MADEAVDGRDSHQDRAGNDSLPCLAGGDMLKEYERSGRKMAFHRSEKSVQRGCVAVNQRLKESA